MMGASVERTTGIIVYPSGSVEVEVCKSGLIMHSLNQKTPQNPPKSLKAHFE